jgi:hypothetical protein
VPEYKPIYRATRRRLRASRGGRPSPGYWPVTLKLVNVTRQLGDIHGLSMIDEKLTRTVHEHEGSPVLSPPCIATCLHLTALRCPSLPFAALRCPSLLKFVISLVMIRHSASQEICISTVHGIAQWFSHGILTIDSCPDSQHRRPGLCNPNLFHVEGPTARKGVNIKNRAGVRVSKA